MTDPQAQDSLLSPGDEAAACAAGMVPDPQIMTQFLTGVHDDWHAVHRDAVSYAIGTPPHLIATAACGALVRLTKYGVYDRTDGPAAAAPCPACAWHVAIATGSTARELTLITPGQRDSAALARCGVTPLAAPAVCRAILAVASDPSHPAVVSQLAAATAHSPGIAAAEDCLDGGCEHRPGSIAARQEWECDLPDAIAVCWTCSLLRGHWAGEQEGSLLEAGMVPAPCSVLSALAAYYGLIRGSRRHWRRSGPVT